MPALISQYVLKVHGRCDLACDHCYVYEHADRSWRIKPRAISDGVVERAASRIAEHAAAHRMRTVHVVLHGGEPLLMGHRGLGNVISTLNARIAPVTCLDLRIHTNGVRLDDDFCALFAEYGVKVGVSLDGDRSAQDRHRTFADGRSSHAQVRAAIELLRRPAYRHLYAGILCTVDLDNDPIAVYEALLEEQPPRIDFLLPHATWDNPPRRPEGAEAPYAEWLARIFLRWTADGRPVAIRLFDSLLSAARGGPSWSESVGLDPVDLLVVETDGSWEKSDSLKTAFDRAPATGLNVFSHAVDEVAARPDVAIVRSGLAGLSAVCQACPVGRICGGGLYAHRYRSGTGFDNPSAYCADLKALIPLVTGKPEKHAVGGPTPAASSARVAVTGAVPPPETTAAHGAGGADAVVHGLSDAAFASLASGPGDVGAIGSLGEMRLSMTRSLVAAVAAQSGGEGMGRVATDGWALLCRLDAEHPAAVQAVFAHPQVQPWAMRCLRPPREADTALDQAHLAGMAAAAALYAQVPAEVVLPVRNAALHVPSFGALRLGGGSERTAVVSVSTAGLSVDHLDARWEMLRRVKSPQLDVTVEDLDPFRDCQQWPIADRLSAAEWGAWRAALTRAGRRLAEELPDYARVLNAGLCSVVPLRPAPGGLRRSSTARRAFGSVALALPPESGILEVELVHEFQHLKLNALLDLYELFDAAYDRRLDVPWRPDRRPIEGVIHGVYAHLAVAELWRARARAGQDDRAPALFEKYRSWVDEAIGALLATGALTTHGMRFVKGMRTTARSWARVHP